MKKIIALLRNTPEQAYTGIGMSVALKYKLTEKWSKRISSEYKDDKFSP
ncbi:type II toxin-antitoxin system YoeB family toxin [Bacteroides faecichinchillae]|nr:type II toxin-antitoxin system YoeB family toxin [Bacteroides faecichinchillae]